MLIKRERRLREMIRFKNYGRELYETDPED